MTTRQIKIEGTEFATKDEAIQHSFAAGGEAILLAGRNFVVPTWQADRLAERGIPFAYLCDVQFPDGTQTIVTIPVNQ